MMVRPGKLAFAVVIAFGIAGAVGAPGSPATAFAQSTATPTPTSTTVTITSTSVPGGSVGAGYSTSLTATGGTAPYAWSVTSGTLPAGLTLNTFGSLSGTPTTTGTSSFTVRAQDYAGRSATLQLTMSVLSTGSMVVVDTATLPNGRVDTPYTATLSASGGIAMYTWMLTSGALPAGLSLSASGTVSGIPVTAGAAAFTVRTTDAQGASATRALTMTVAPATGTPGSVSIPPVGFGIIVFSGGTVNELVAASNCTQQTLAFWATVNGQFVGYVPNTTVGAVNAQFLSIFRGGVLPTNTPLIARC